MALSDNLISYWSLEEASGTRSDSVGTNHLTDNNTVTSTTGKVGTCASFASASSEYLSCADNASLQTGNIDFTFAAWVNLTTKVNFRPFVSKFDSITAKREYLLEHDPGTDRFIWVVSATGSANVTVSWGSAPSTATWYYIVAWHDATANTINIQVDNGTPVSTAHTTGVFTSDCQFRIGGVVGLSGAQQYHNGLIDEVGFWKRVLTSDERTDMWNAGAGRNYAYITGGGAATKAIPLVTRPLRVWEKRR